MADDTSSTGYSNVRLTSHASARMKRYGYCMADIDRMIEQNDERLIMIIKTVLPRTTGNTAEEGRLRSAQDKLHRAKINHSRCTKRRTKLKLEATIQEMERVVRRLEERGGSATQLAEAAMRAQTGEMLANARYESGLEYSRCALLR